MLSFVPAKVLLDPNIIKIMDSGEQCTPPLPLIDGPRFEDQMECDPLQLLFPDIYLEYSSITYLRNILLYPQAFKG